MIKKIIAGGRTFADQRALDVAIKLGLSHGGWIPKGRITKTGKLPEKYKLKEMPTDNYFECIEQNVKDSKGTLIISYGKLAGDLDHARKVTLNYGHQLLGIDLKQTIPFKAASLVNDWVQLVHIDVLYVIGPKSCVHHNAWKHTAHIVESAVLLDLMEAPADSHITHFTQEEYLDKLPVPPKTVDEAVDQIITDMPLKDRVQVANLKKGELRSLNLCLAVFIKNQLLQKDVNRKLFESCSAVSGKDNLNENNAALVIIEKLWEKLQDTHHLRVIK
jgi:hypothetical protein